MTITIGGILKCQKSQQGKVLLECDLGKFVITDNRLKQLPVGNHEGLFEVEQIKSNAQVTDRGVIIELIANLKRFALTNVPEKPVIQTEKSQIDLFNAQQAEQADETSSDDEDAKLFGELWPLSDKVKPDFTIDRDILRKQSQRLRELGYLFESTEQIWLKKSA